MRLASIELFWIWMACSNNTAANPAPTNSSNLEFCRFMDYR